MNRSLIIVVALFLALAGGTFAWQFHRGSPEYAVEKVLAIHSKNDISANKDFLTDQGQRVEQFLILGMPEPNTTIGKPRVAGDRMSVEVTDAKDTKNFLFIRGGVWKLDDVVFTRAAGHQWNAKLSEVAEPLAVFNRVKELETKDQVNAADRDLTAKGKKVVLYAMDKNLATGGTATPGVFGDPIIVSDREVRFPMSTQDASASFVMVKTTDWQFDDVIIHHAQNRDINQTLSYMIDNPLLSKLKSLTSGEWLELVANFIKGFSIGYGGGR